MTGFTSFIYRASCPVSAFATGGIEMRPVPLVPTRHAVLREEYNQLHAAEAPFVTVPVVKIGQPVVFRSHGSQHF